VRPPLETSTTSSSRVRTWNSAALTRMSLPSTALAPSSTWVLVAAQVEIETAPAPE
jgi:hypothetical protein